MAPAAAVLALQAQLATTGYRLGRRSSGLHRLLPVPFERLAVPSPASRG